MFINSYNLVHHYIPLNKEYEIRKCGDSFIIFYISNINHRSRSAQMSQNQEKLTIRFSEKIIQMWLHLFKMIFTISLHLFISYYEYKYSQ